MKFAIHQAKDAFEQSALKLSVVALSFMSLAFLVLLLMNFSKDPIIIERACESTLLKTTSDSQTPDEVNSFLRVALSERFDTDIKADAAPFLTQENLILRKKEQDEIKRGGLDQHMIVRSITLQGDHFAIELDRVIAAGPVRSDLPLKLNVKILSQARNLANPYGLALSEITEIHSEKK